MPKAQRQRQQCGSGRARLEAWYREQAEIAPHIDRLVTHWIDPGDQRTTSMDTIVEQHNAVMAIYREKNPKIRGTLSTWFMGNSRRGGNGPIDFEGIGKLAAHPQLDRDSDVAWGWNIGSATDLSAIVAAGRKAAVWGWYTADDEINPALWVRISVLERAFPHNVTPRKRRALAPLWTEGLAWYSLDDAFPGMNMPNLYVAGKLMQDLSLDAQALLDEFCRGFVGEANAPAFAAALRAVERARTLSNCYHARVLDAIEPPSAWKMPNVEQSANWLDNTAAIVDAAIAALPKVTYDPRHTAGLEAAIYKQKLAALKKTAGVK